MSIDRSGVITLVCPRAQSCYCCCCFYVVVRAGCRRQTTLLGIPGTALYTRVVVPYHIRFCSSCTIYSSTIDRTLLLLCLRITYHSRLKVVMLVRVIAIAHVDYCCCCLAGLLVPAAFEQYWSAWPNPTYDCCSVRGCMLSCHCMRVRTNGMTGISYYMHKQTSTLRTCLSYVKSTTTMPLIRLPFPLTSCMPNLSETCLDNIARIIYSMYDRRCSFCVLVHS